MVIIYANAFSDQAGSGRAPALPHGGNRDAFRLRFPHAREPFVDLSTGINPCGYPLPAFPQTALTLLPQEKDLKTLKSVAAQYFNIPSPEFVLPVTGLQSVITRLAEWLDGTSMAILGPTYSGYAQAAHMARIKCETVLNVNDLPATDMTVVVNPNNPDGRVRGKEEMCALAQSIADKGGILVVDEAFMDALPEGESMASCTGIYPLVVLRSFGKFFGLPGVRLGFAIARPAWLERLEVMLGPWAVSGPALFAGITALQDSAWIAATRQQLAQKERRLQELLTVSGLRVIGSTPLFCLAETAQAGLLYQRLGENGIMVRAFAESHHWLRFGLPGAEEEWARLAKGLSDFGI
jgi:cobalamin biosynthesis protein CobC